MTLLDFPTARGSFQQDFYVPYFEVRLAGKELGGDVIRDTIQVTYKDNVDSVDSFELTINNWDAEQRTLKYSDDRLFDPGQTLEISMGYFGDGEPRKMITGHITSMRPSFPSGGQPTLSISGLNLLHQFREKQRSDVYEKMTDTKIAKRIAERLRVKLKPGSNSGESEHEYLIQNNQYDIVFLLERARRIGYDLYVIEGDEPALYFGPPKRPVGRPLRLTYAASGAAKQDAGGGGGERRLLLQQFSPNLTTANQVNAVTVTAWDALKKEPIRGEAKRDDLNLDEPDGVARARKAFEAKEEVIADRPVRNKAEADQLARETLRRIARDTVKGSGSVIGVPELRAGTTVRIDGLGERFSGAYFVTASTHSIGNDGYTTQFDCRLEGI